MDRLSLGERQALLTELVDEMRKADSWAGETHQQKCIYVLQEMLGVPLGFDYVLYKHGPFSFDLRDELTEMRADLLLQLEPRTSYGPSYKPGPLGARAKRLFPSVITRHKRALDFVATKLSVKNVSELEQLVTAFFVFRDNPRLSNREIADQIVSIKPHISTEAAMSAFTEIMSIRRSAQLLGLVAGQP